MDINATLLGQMLTFAILVWVTMKYVWPPLSQAMEERQKKIAEGLQAAERGVRSLEEAQKDIEKRVAEAKVEAAGIVEQSQQRAQQFIEQAKQEAEKQKSEVVKRAEVEIDQLKQSLRDELRQEVAQLVIASTEKLLGEVVDQKRSDAFLQKLLAAEEGA